MSGEEQKGIGRHEVFLSPKEVAARYGVSPQWPYRCEDLQKYKRKIGRYVRFALSDLVKFEQERWDVPSDSHKYPGEILMRHRVNYEKTVVAKRPVIFDLESKS